jgi:hypothetical protein
MSAILDELHALITHLEDEEHALAGRFRAAWDALKADEPKLLGEAEADAADVVHTAATEGVVPAEQKAVADGEALIEDTGHDIAAAVEGSGKPGA